LRPRRDRRMTRHEGRAASHMGPENTPRLRLKPKAPTTGHVDGAWWPRSDDLTTELPDLLAVLSVRLGAIDRVMYNLAEWATVPRRLVTGGRAVRLDGYRLQPANTLQVLGVGRDKILLLVVPPHTDPDVAHEAMMTAAAPSNDSTVGDLLAIGAHDGEAPNAYHRPTFRRRIRRFRP
jgi:Family of unknown function (DUF5994)